MTIDKLWQEGHTLVEYTISQEDYEEMQTVYTGFVNNGMIPSMRAHAAQRFEYLMPYYNLMTNLTFLPDWFKRGLAWFLNKFTNEQRTAKRILALQQKDHEGVNALHQRWDAWRVKLDEQWKAAGIDALLTPCQYHVAFKSELTDLALFHDYYLLWNFCHFPAGVIPVTAVREDEGKGTYIEDIDRRWVDRAAHLIE